MYPRLFVSRLKFFFLQFERCFETTNEFLRKHFNKFYNPPPKKKMIRVSKNKKNHQNWRTYESDYSNCTSNYFNRKIPELDNMSNKQLQIEFVEVRKSLMDKSKILYLYKRSMSSARNASKISQVNITRSANLVH